MAEQVVHQELANRHKARLIVVVAVGVVLLAAVLVWWFVLRQPATETPEGVNPYAQTASELEGQAPPSDPLQRALHFGQIGFAKYELGLWEEALDWYFQAQQLLDQNRLSDQFTYYQPIADTYLKLGNKSQAKIYLQKQLAYLEAYQATEPDDGGTTLEAIQVIKEQIDQL